MYIYIHMSVCIFACHFSKTTREKIIRNLKTIIKNLILHNLVMEQTQICMGHCNAMFVTSGNDTSIVSRTRWTGNIRNSTLENVKR